MPRWLSLRELESVLRAEDDAQFALRFVTLGTVWLIPDADANIVTRAGASGWHPWVAVEDYQPPFPTVRCALRTTRDPGEQQGVFTGRRMVPGLDEQGWIIPALGRPIPIRVLREHRDRCLGRLPPEIREKLRCSASPSARGGPPRWIASRSFGGHTAARALPKVSIAS